MFPSTAVPYYFRFNEAEFFCTEANKAPEVDFDSLTWNINFKKNLNKWRWLQKKLTINFQFL